MAFSAYFTEASAQKYLFYFGCLFYVVCTSIVVVVEPFLSLPCRHSENHTTELEFENILFRYDPCDDIRQPALLFFTRTECERGRHLLMAVFLGSLIGYERRSGDRPAGIRTMSLVSLGSALFTINSTFAFLAGPMVSAMRGFLPWFTISLALTVKIIAGLGCIACIGSNSIGGGFPWCWSNCEIFGCRPCHWWTPSPYSGYHYCRWWVWATNSPLPMIFFYNSFNFASDPILLLWITSRHCVFTSTNFSTRICYHVYAMQQPGLAQQ